MGQWNTSLSTLLWGIKCNHTSKQFLRSLFLVFTKAGVGEAAEAVEDGEENSAKRARLQREMKLSKLEWQKQLQI